MSADGNTSFVLGQNASRDPDQIDERAYASGININIERGVLSPRWGYRRLELTFPNGGIVLPNQVFRSYEEIFRTGRFQAQLPYVQGEDYYILVVISGIIFLVNQDTEEVTIIPIDDGSYLNYGAPRLNWSAAGDFTVIFDYPARPVIIEGYTARRSNPADFEVPISVLGTYNQNRLMISNAGNEYTGGDPSGNPATPDAPITFEEVLLPAAPYFGQIFKLPTAYNNNEIRAMSFLQVTDSSTGIGPLIIGTEKEIYFAATNIPRANWEASQFASNLTFNTGISGQRAITHVNSDCFFMSPDAEIRPLSMSRDEQKRWSKVPLSQEVHNWLKLKDRGLASYAALGYFQNKVFATANPIRVPAVDLTGTKIIDVCHAGFVVLELNTISTATQQSPPAWAGLWTGIRPMDICVNNSKCFVMAKDDSIVNHLYEITPDKTYDVIDGKVRRVKSRVYTREYAFQNPHMMKEVRSLMFNIEKVKGEFELGVKYKPSHAESFVQWRDFKHRAPWRMCEMPKGCEFHGLAGHSFRELVLGSPEGAATCNAVTGDNYSLFKKMQLRLDITGIYWEIKDLVITAVDKPQNELKVNCHSYPEVKVCQECSDDWTLGRDEGCQAQTL